MSTLLRQLQSALEHEFELVQKFMLTLQAEAEALAIPNENEALDASTQQKNQFAQWLEQAGEKRQTLLAKLGYSTDKAGLDAAVAMHPELQPACESLYDLSKHASDLNASNGVIIDTYLKHNQKALETLRNLAGIDNLYDASGRTRPVPANNKKSIKAG